MGQARVRIPEPLIRQVLTGGFRCAKPTKALEDLRVLAAGVVYCETTEQNVVELIVDSPELDNAHLDHRLPLYAPEFVDIDCPRKNCDGVQ